MRSLSVLIGVCACCLLSCSSEAPRDSTRPEAPAKPEYAKPKAEGEGPTLTRFEQSLLDPLLREIRQGVVPFSDNSVGICKGTGKECKEFLGTNPGTLPQGRYMVRAELRVPDVGPKGTWKVRFETECTTTTTSGDSKSTSTKTYSNEYDVRYVGKNRGYRLSPLMVIESPMKGAERKCDYTLTALHPDGNKEFTGSWSIPQAPE